MWVSAGMTEEEMAWRRWVGIGSSGQVVGWLERMSLETSVSERGEKEVRDCVFVVMKLLLVCGVRNWSLMVFVLFVKKVAKSSAVRVDEGGGGGGQRRERFEECARVGTVVNFVVVVCHFSSGDICREGRKLWLIHTKVGRVFRFVPFPLCSP